MQAKTNLELKHRCSDFDLIRKALKELGIKKAVVKKQKDFFFNLPVTKSAAPARLKVRIEGDQKTAVYYTRPDFEKTKGAIAEVALYSIKDNELLPYLQKVLGVSAVVEKTREVWKKDNTVFHLDVVKGVGKIFEVELQKKGKITKQDRKLFKSYQTALLPYLGEVVKGSNAGLVAKNKLFKLRSRRVV